MQAFWTWGIRNPALLALAAAGLSLAAGIAGSALALSAMAFFGVIAESANHLGRKAKARADRERSRHQAATPIAKLMVSHFPLLEEAEERHAA